ncbi:MAG: nicotinate-nucleotide pyrophosphorylase (carboxylating) [Gammaproteobacteria bacterium]|jgi:nicotinate-nucleotide pyrophosphorylase (carboxylating)
MTDSLVRAATLTPQSESPDAADIARLVTQCLTEDIGNGDLTARLIDPSTACRARVIVREHAVLCGTAWFDQVYASLDADVSVQWEATDGDRIEPGQLICTVTGPARGVNSGERTALNLLQTLSGTATVARRHADAVAGTATVILDTRKTLPGLRRAQKYAVRCGGCANHRMGLHDAMLIKENHIAAAGGLRNAVNAARAANPDAPLEVEVETLGQLDEALGLEVTMIMLDNFTVDGIRDAVARSRGKARLEVSGGVELDDLAELAATGVDFISIGSLTKHLQATDFSMRADN